MTGHTNRSLFGGALLAAGLCAPALAQNFAISYGYIQTFAQAHSGNVYVTDFDYGQFFGPFSVSSSASRDTASAYGMAQANAAYIRTDASITNAAKNGVGFGWHYKTLFTVDQDLTARVTWDWTQGYGYLRITDLTNNSVLFFESGSFGGSLPVSLDDANEYLLSGYSDVGGAGDLRAHWEVAVPAPGSAGLLGLAGLAAARRRRTGLG